MGIPVRLVDSLEDMSERALREVEVSPSGASPRFAEWDVDLSVPAQLAVALKRTPAAQALAALASSATSGRNAEAARRNGARGGRPKKPVG